MTEAEAPVLLHGQRIVVELEVFALTPHVETPYAHPPGRPEVCTVTYAPLRKLLRDGVAVVKAREWEQGEIALDPETGLAYSYADPGDPIAWRELATDDWLESDEIEARLIPAKVVPA